MWGSRPLQTLHHSDNSHRWIHLHLDSSVYDLAFVCPIISHGSQKAIAKAVMLLLVNGLLQGISTFFLWTKATGDRRVRRDQIFGGEGVNGTTIGVCTRVSPDMLNFVPSYTNLLGLYPKLTTLDDMENTITCTQDEILLTAMSTFRHLSYGEDKWTTEHAEQLSSEYRNATGRWVNLEDVVANLGRHKKQFATECGSAGCGFDGSRQIDEDFWKEQIFPILRSFCLVGDAELCFNFAAKFEYYRDPQLTEFFAYATDIFGARDFLKSREENISSFQQSVMPDVKMHAPSVCEAAMRKFCPQIVYGDYTVQSNRYRISRKTLCGDLDDVYLSSDPAYRSDGKVEDPNLTSVYTGSKRYNNEEVGTMSRLFTILQLLMLLLWNIAIATEIKDIVIRFMVIWGLPESKPTDEVAQIPEVVLQAEDSPGGAATNVEPSTTELLGTASVTPGGAEGAQEEEDEFDEHPLTSLTNWQRFRAITLSLIPRAVLAFFIFLAGVEFIFAAETINDVILNSLALTFLYSIDEMLFAISASRVEAETINRCSPLKVKFGMRFGRITRLLPPMGILALVVLATYSIYQWMSFHSEARMVADAFNCFCQKSGDRCMAKQFMERWTDLTLGSDIQQEYFW